MKERGNTSFLFRSVFVSVAGAVVAGLSGLLATGVMARSLQLDLFGKILLLMSAVNALAILEGMRPLVIYRATNYPNQLGTLFKVSTRISIAIFLISTLVVFLLYNYNLQYKNLDSTIVLLYSITAGFYFIVLQLCGFLDAELDTNFTSLTRNVATVSTYLFFILLAYEGCGIEYFSLILLSSNIIVAFVLLLRMRYLGLWRKYRESKDCLNSAEIVKDAMNNILFNVSAVTLNMVDRAIIGLRLGSAVAGTYTAPSDMTLRAGGLVRAGVQVILPWAVRKTSNSKSESLKLWFLSEILVITISCIPCVLAVAYRLPLTVMLLGENFASSADIMGIFCIGMVVSLIGYLNITYLNSHGDFLTQRKYYGIAALLLVTILYVASDYITIEGIAWIVLCARLVDLLVGLKILTGCLSEQKKIIFILFSLYLMSLVFAWYGNAVFASIVPLCLIYILRANIINLKNV